MTDTAVPMQTLPGGLLGLTRAAALLGTTRDQVLTMIEAGQLAAVEMPTPGGKQRRLYVRPEDIAGWFIREAATLTALIAQAQDMIAAIAPDVDRLNAAADNLPIPGGNGGDGADPEPIVFDIDAAAEYLDCSRRKVYQLIEQGELRAINLPGRTGSAAMRVPRAAADDFISRLCREAGIPA